MPFGFLKKAAKKIIPKALPFAASFIPGIGPAASAVLGAAGPWKDKIGDFAFDAAGAVLGARLETKESLRALQGRYDLLGNRYGMTPQEIAGAGVGSGAGYGLSQTLGNSAKEFAAQQRQMEFTASENQKNRMTNLATSQIAADASENVASINTGAQLRIADLVNSREWQKLSQNWAVNNPEYNLYMKELGMGKENAQMAYIFARNGLSLSNISDMTQGEFNKRMTAAMSEIALSQEGRTGLLREGGRQGQAVYNDFVLGKTVDDPVSGGLPPTPLMPGRSTLPRFNN